MRLSARQTHLAVAKFCVERADRGIAARACGFVALATEEAERLLLLFLRGAVAVVPAGERHVARPDLAVETIIELGRVAVTKTSSDEALGIPRARAVGHALEEAAAV